jgi:hypothetical protein
VRLTEEHLCASAGGDLLVQRKFFALILGQSPAQMRG